MAAPLTPLRSLSIFALLVVTRKVAVTTALTRASPSNAADTDVASEHLSSATLGTSSTRADQLTTSETNPGANHSGSWEGGRHFPSHATDGTYSRREAEEYARICAATYCRRASPRMRRPLVIAAGGEVAMVGRLGQRCVVAFRGTDNLANVAEDLNSYKLVSMPHCPGCEVGSGFLEAYAAVEFGVKRALRILGCKHVAVTGHSLGAAVAIIALYDLRRSGFRIQTSYTFGQPRVGNPAFNLAFRTALGPVDVFRLVHGEDPIVLLGPLGSVVHDGTAIYLPGDDVRHDHGCYLGVKFATDTPRGRICGAKCNPNP